LAGISIASPFAAELLAETKTIALPQPKPA